MADIKNRLDSINKAINQAEMISNPMFDTVQLLAVSKTWPAELLRQAANAGQTRFGENYIQEALIKITALTDLNLEWHFIGPIQSNKTKDIATHFDWVQSLDRLKIARRLSNQRPESLGPLNVCVQVNIDDEACKSGVAITETLAFADDIAQLKNLTLRGLMIIPSKTDVVSQQHAAFKTAYSLFEQLKNHYETVDTLSMGMSADMGAAIEQGSTMVRIGTALFGTRLTSSAQ